MNYGDFSSLVQLGVGLHAGTALLQLYGDVGVQPTLRALARIRELNAGAPLRDEGVADELGRLEADFAIFRIRLFNEFRKYVVINLGIATALLIVLVVISYKAGDALPDWLSVVLAAVSTLPALITVSVLWLTASAQFRPLKIKVDALERRSLEQQR